MDALLQASWYLDPTLLDWERATLFREGPVYVGHERMVPKIGDQRPVTVNGQALLMVRGPGGVEVFHNVCRHRQATLITEPSNARHIQCPFHRWTYDLDGALLGAPHFPSKPSCRDLLKVPTTTWNGLVLAGPAALREDFSSWAPTDVFDFSRYTFGNVVEMECRQNWKSFVEVYLDLYHVAPFHPGLSGFVTCSDLRWTMGDFSSVQQVGINGDLRTAHTPVYAVWQSKVLEATGGAPPPHGAVWAFYYPNLMLEWNPGALMISTLEPRSPTQTLNRVEFYYDAEVLDRVPGFVEAHQAAYFETANEDEVLGQRMDAGRAGLVAAGLDDVGPVHLPMEEGIVHFHRYVLDRFGR